MSLGVPVGDVYLAVIRVQVLSKTVGLAEVI